MDIRPCKPEDAAQFLELKTCLAEETQFMLLEPGEDKKTVEEQHAVLEDIDQSDHRQLFLAVDGSDVVGFATAMRRPFKRVLHSFYLVIGVRQSHWGRGIGKGLMDAVEGWAAAAGARRLELTVLADNDRALRLYQGLGFVVEGTRKANMLINGQFKDELFMAKLL